MAFMKENKKEVNVLESAGGFTNFYDAIIRFIQNCPSKSEIEEKPAEILYAHTSWLLLLNNIVPPVPRQTAITETTT